ncbi:response regulator [Pendulispora rubella]|uniref:histidine kinase n=1 Tax=Pendulispora rubella TaxID=2741070 RepID=A0ABZ2L2A3_9BACT
MDDHGGSLAAVRLLLVADDEADASLVRSALARLQGLSETSFTWTRAADAASFALARDEHDVGLVDFELAKRTNFELLERHGGDTPIVVLARLADQDADPFAGRPALAMRAFDILDRSQLATPRFERTLRRVLERRAARAALQRSDARFRDVLEQIPEAILVHDRGRILHVNARTLRDLGCERPDQLVGSSLLDLVREEDRALLDAPASRSRASAGNPIICRFVLADGSMLAAEVIEVPIVWGGRPASALLARDVSQHLDTQARLLLADRFSRGSSLAASVAHEINNPLAYVRSNLVFAIDELARLEGGERINHVREALADARQGAERVEIIARDLKIFSQARDDRKGAVDVHRVLELAFNMTKSEIRERARLVTEYAQVPDIIANDGRLAHVFINLLLNATQAIPEGRAREHTVRVATRSDRDRVIVEVSDTGAGMSAKVRERIFDPFFTTTPTVRTGLGLFVCQQIVHALRGRITVESELGRGSTFRVELPANVSATLPIARPHVQRAHLLIVDDEPLVCSSLQRSLKRDYEVTAVQSARAALDLMAGGTSFDLVLCDLMMPEMSGMDLYEELRRTNPVQCTKLIFFTGGASTAGAREFLERVPNPRLEKPADIARIRELVRERIAS